MDTLTKPIETNTDIEIPIREQALAGYEQIQEGKTEDIDIVFSRLKEKYKHATL